MADLRSPFCYDFVGSFLRPQALKNARAQFKAGEIDRAALTEIENAQIKLLIEKQKRAGFHAITDGEFRRSYWHLDFMWGFQGIDEVELNHGYYFQGEETTPGSIKLTGKISGENHPFVEHFKFAGDTVSAVSQYVSQNGDGVVMSVEDNPATYLFSDIGNTVYPFGKAAFVFGFFGNGDDDTGRHVYRYNALGDSYHFVGALQQILYFRTEKAVDDIAFVVQSQYDVRDILLFDGVNDSAGDIYIVSG